MSVNLEQNLVYEDRKCGPVGRIRSQKIEEFVAATGRVLQLFVVIVVYEAGFHASFYHVEVGLSECLGDVSFGLNLFHLLVNNCRLEAASIEQ